MPGILPMKMIRVGSTTSSRIAQACDRCRSKKIRCDGIRPTCTQCANVGFECKTSDKLSRRAFPRGYTESLEDRVRGLEAEVRELKQLLDEKDEKIDMLSRLHSFSSPSRNGSTSLSPGNAAQIKDDVQSSRSDYLHVEIPAPVQAGGPSTGSSTTTAFVESFDVKTHDHEKRPPNLSSTSLVLQPQASRQNIVNAASKTPPRILSDQYINIFFQEWQPLLPLLHRPTFLKVYEQYLAGPDAGNWQSNKQAIAQLFLIFEISALSCGHQTKTATPSYENQWRRALFSTSSTPTVSVIQCQILAQLCYLLRADYSNLSRHRGISVGMCHELGLHQSHKYLTLSTFECETRKKVFWCQYVLDKFTSAATGTPTLLRDSDVSTEYPAEVDDENISMQGISPSLPGELTKISSSLALFRVTKILSKTLEHLYPSKASYQLSLNKLHAISDELDQWSEELPEHLRLRFTNDKPSTNLISCRSPILSLSYFYIRSLVHRPQLCHGSGSGCASATIVLSAAGKHTLQILDLLDERRMNYTFPFNRKELLLTAAFSILWQSIDLDEESKLLKDNQKSLTLALGMLARENQTVAAEFQQTATAFMHLEGRRPSPKHIEIETPAAKLINSMTAPQAHNSKTKSTRKHLQAIASRFSTFSNSKSSKPEEPRRATVPRTTVNHSQSLSPQHRADSTVSLSSTRSAPVYPMTTPSPGACLDQTTMNYNRTPNINLDYYPLGDDPNDTQTSAASSTMLPPRKPTQHQMSPTIANSNWDSLLNLNANISTPASNPAIPGFDASNILYGTVNTSSANHHSTGSGMNNDWMADPTGWGLPTMDYGSKSNVPQSLLSFSGESMTSAEDLVFSASSNNGSGTNSSASNNGSNASESVVLEGKGTVNGKERQSAYQGITIPVDDIDEFEFADIDA